MIDIISIDKSNGKETVIKHTEEKQSIVKRLHENYDMTIKEIIEHLSGGNFLQTSFFIYKGDVKK